MIEIKNVTLLYETFPALTNFSATIPEQSITGLVGINGAGKSSLIHCMLGLIQEFDGQITIAGHDVKKERLWIKQHCAFAPEETELFEYLTGEEFLNLIATIKKVPHPKQAIEHFSTLFDLTAHLPVLINEYSHGLRQKMLLSAALLGEPDFIFIDEAINGLDTLSLLRLQEHLLSLKQQGKTIVIASHVLPLLSSWCDQLLILHQGRALQMLTKEQIARDSRTIEQIFVDLISSTS